MRKLPLRLTFSAALLLAAGACSNENEENSPSVSVDVPTTYEFLRNGISSVSYPGQTTRLAMGAELNDAFLDFNQTQEGLTQMYANQDANGGDVDPFTEASLNASDKSLRSKTAASYQYFNANASESALIKAEFSSWITGQVQEIFPYVNQAATPGVAGQLADGTSARYVNDQGLEYNQAFGKGLIGALVLDQILNNYLDAGVLDAGTNRSNNDNAVLAEGKNYTTMEHKWDEAYGYLFGGAANGADPLNTLGADDDFLNKYLGRIATDPDFAGLENEIFDAFKKGRAAIVAKNYTLRDAQADILKEKLSEIIGIRSVYYLESAKSALAAGDTGTAFHDLSEAYGFIYSLRFTQNPATGAPYFNAAEVAEFLGANGLMGDGPNGFWDLKQTTLTNMAETLAARFNFTVAQAAP
jgi:hypothetical protein